MPGVDALSRFWYNGGRSICRMQDDSANEQQSTGNVSTVLLLCTDLMFAVQLQNMVKRAGLRYANIRPGNPMPPASLLIVDLAAHADILAAIREAPSMNIPELALGPHLDA